MGEFAIRRTGTSERTSRILELDEIEGLRGTIRIGVLFRRSVLKIVGSGIVGLGLGAAPAVTGKASGSMVARARCGG